MLFADIPPTIAGAVGIGNLAVRILTLAAQVVLCVLDDRLGYDAANGISHVGCHNVVIGLSALNPLIHLWADAAQYDGESTASSQSA